MDDSNLKVIKRRNSMGDFLTVMEILVNRFKYKITNEGVIEKRKKSKRKKSRRKKSRRKKSRRKKLIKQSKRSNRKKIGKIIPLSLAIKKMNMENNNISRGIENETESNNDDNHILKLTNDHSLVKKEYLYNNKYSIHFGISEYIHWRNLKNAENDTKCLEDLFSNKFNFRTKIFLGKSVTKSSIESEIVGLSNIVEKDDLVVITFSGHGTSVTFDNAIGGFIVPYDANKSINLTELVSMKFLTEWSNWLSAKHVVFLLDCCFSGLSQVRGNHLKSIHTLKHLLNLKCRYVINAGTCNQVVYDGIGDHSPFVSSILNSEVINNGQCSIKNLAEDIVHKVSELSEYRQTPVSGSLSGDQGGCAFLAL